MGEPLVNGFRAMKIRITKKATTDDRHDGK